MRDVDQVDFFTDADVVQDPHTYFKDMRSKCPVRHEKYHGAVMVTGYDEAMEALKNENHALSNCVAVMGPIAPLPFTPEGDDISQQLKQHYPEMPWSAHLVSYDGPEHIALRIMLTTALTQSRLKKNEAYVEMLVDRLIDQIIDQGSCEFVSEYAHALSTLVIADLLGVPEADRQELLIALGPTPTQIEGDADFKMGPDPLSLLESRFRGYMEERRGAPQDDLMSDLANARFKDGTQPDLDVPVRLAKFLFGAGQDTSARLVAETFKILGDYPDVQKRLRAEPNKIADFVEETLRFETPTKVVSRLCTATTTIGGERVKAGTVTTVGLGAANRDPAHFDNPDEFNIDRPNLRDHVAFSRGAHACPGAPLARVEARVTMQRFLARTSEIKISEAKHGPPDARSYAYEPTFLLRGLSALHIEFTKA